MPQRPSDLPPSVEAYAARNLADRLRALAAELTAWSAQIERAAIEIETIHEVEQAITRPYAFAVQQALSGELQGLMHAVVNLGHDAAGVEAYRAERFIGED